MLVVVVVVVALANATRLEMSSTAIRYTGEWLAKKNAFPNSFLLNVRIKGTPRFHFARVDVS